MAHEIDVEVYKALRNNGHNPEYLMGLDYEIADWEKADLLKRGFPVNAEGVIFTNGRHAVKIETDQHKDAEASVSFMQALDAIMKLKTADPELSVYEVHNHPSAANLWGASGRDISSMPKEFEHSQSLLSSVPSPSDLNHWNKLHNVAGAAIYHQDADEIRIWKEGDERNRIGTKLAIEYEMRKYDALGFKYDEAIKVPVNIYWATEDENESNTEYIYPSEWQEKKSMWTDQLSFHLTSAPWSR